MFIKFVENWSNFDFRAMQQKKFPTRIVSNFKSESGNIMLDQIRCVDKVRLIQRLGDLDENTAMDCLKILRLMFHQ